MIHLRLRSEFSFRHVYGKVETIARVAGGGALTDDGTWGHVAWAKACKAAGVPAIFGVEILVVSNASLRTRQPGVRMAFLARDTEGLEEVYRLLSTAHAAPRYYYVPRLDYQDVAAVSEHVIILSGAGADLTQLPPRLNVYLEMSPENPAWNRRVATLPGYSRVVCASNRYPTPEDRVAYEILAGAERQTSTGPLHIPDEWELRALIPEATDDDFLNTERIAASCTAVLPKAEMVKPPRPATLREMCHQGAFARGLRMAPMDPVYAARLDRELKMIAEKEFEDYFYVLADMVAYAKTQMLVGPARGSAAGSLVCYLLGITDVDPIVHGLMFERFIDVTRSDLPDVDLDFADDKRDLVYEYLGTKYGAERVGRLGTVLRFKVDSCLGWVARALGIPDAEIRDVKDAIVKRSSGDARAALAIHDALEGLDLGRKLVEKYPSITIAAALENHAQHSGKHAAGVVVSEYPVRRYATVQHDGVLQIDKKDAETLNMLKIDVLGLRTLTILADTLDQIGKDRDWLITYPLDDPAAFDVFNAERYSGIFQFEGYALQALCRQMKVRSFDDVAVIGALARPGPLHCGAAADFVERRTGTKPPTPIHPLVEPLTRDALGVVIYQEHVMSIAREFGDLTWEDVNQLRRAMSKTLGDEFFSAYWERFRDGAARKHNVPEVEARRVWEKMCTFGSWAFNKSHAVSYGLISYWCAVLKAHYPLQFAAASLRNAKDEDQAVRILRDLVTEGFTYVPVDPARSDISWSVVDGQLLGGLTNIRGIGARKAADIVRIRAAGGTLPPGLRKLLAEPTTPYDSVFGARDRFGDLYANPKAHNIHSGAVSYIKDIADPGDYVFIGRIKDKKLRDMNEYQSLVKRKGRRILGQSQFLNLVLEDDTGQIIARIGRYDFTRMAVPIIEHAKIGDYYLWKGRIGGDGWRLVYIDKCRRLEP